MRQAITKLRILWLLLSSVALAADATVSQIIANPTAFDGQHVTVSGTAQFVRPKTSHKGNDYETFSLCDQACVNVFTWGNPTKVLYKASPRDKHGALNAIRLRVTRFG
jgi:hypothetical protein